MACWLFLQMKMLTSTSKMLPNYDSGLAKVVMGRYMQFASENIDCTHADLIRIYTYPTFDEAMGSNAVERCLDEMQKILQENIEAIYLLITQRNDQMIEAKDQIASQISRTAATRRGSCQLVLRF